MTINRKSKSAFRRSSARIALQVQHECGKLENSAWMADKPENMQYIYAIAKTAKRCFPNCKTFCVKDDFVTQTRFELVKNQTTTPVDESDKIVLETLKEVK